MGHPRVIYLWFYDTQMIGNDAETVMKMRKNHRDPHYVTTANKIAVKLKRDPLCYDYTLGHVCNTLFRKILRS